MLYGGIEAGGTKFICAVGSNHEDIIDEIRINTTTPSETIGHAIKFFQKHNASKTLTSIGIGAFGPLDLRLDSPTYGHITATPKSGWSFTDFVGRFRNTFKIPIGFDTDVNVSALAEYHWGNATDLKNFIYITVGTGIGGGAIVGGKLLHGMVHPEMGHTFIPHDWNTDPFAGICPFHSDCFEGLASGVALEQRWGQKPENLPSNHSAWPLEAQYIALAIVNYICCCSPQRIIIGGGVMEQLHLFPLIRKKVQELLNGFIESEELIGHIDHYIVPPGLGKKSGIMGAIALAQKMIND